jgi:hypothetical protein
VSRDEFDTIESCAVGQHANGITIERVARVDSEKPVKIASGFEHAIG